MDYDSRGILEFKDDVGWDYLEIWLMLANELLDVCCWEVDDF